MPVSSTQVTSLFHLSVALLWGTVRVVEHMEELMIDMVMLCWHEMDGHCIQS
jgi:hypothetical protein